MKKKTHSCGTDTKVSRMHSCGIVRGFVQTGQPSGTGEDSASREGSSLFQVGTRTDSGCGWQSRLGLVAEQGQNQYPCRTALGQAQGRASLGQGESSAGYDRVMLRLGSGRPSIKGIG